MTATASLVTYERTGQIALITLNRPEKLNAFSDDVVRELAARMRQFDTDPEAFVAVLRGAGRAFSSGADVQQRQLRPREELERLLAIKGRKRGRPRIGEVRSCPWEGTGMSRRTWYRRQKENPFI